MSKPGTVRSISARLHIFRRDSRHNRAVVSYWRIHVHLLNACSTGYIKGFINGSSIILTCIDKYCFIQNSARYIFFKSMQPVPRFKLILITKKRIDTDIFIKRCDGLFALVDTGCFIRQCHTTTVQKPTPSFMWFGCGGRR